MRGAGAGGGLVLDAARPGTGGEAEDDAGCEARPGWEVEVDDVGEGVGKADDLVDPGAGDGDLFGDLEAEEVAVEGGHFFEIGNDDVDVVELFEHREYRGYGSEIT